MENRKNNMLIFYQCSNVLRLGIYFIYYTHDVYARRMGLKTVAFYICTVKVVRIQSVFKITYCLDAIMLIMGLETLILKNVWYFQQIFTFITKM